MLFSYYMFYTLHVVEPLRYDSVLTKEPNEWMNGPPTSTVSYSSGTEVVATWTISGSGGGKATFGLPLAAESSTELPELSLQNTWCWRAAYSPFLPFIPLPVTMYMIYRNRCRCIRLRDRQSKAGTNEPVHASTSKWSDAYRARFRPQRKLRLQGFSL